jgi:hypothetical protein
LVKHSAAGGIPDYKGDNGDYMKIISVYLMESKTGWKYVVMGDTEPIAEGKIKGKKDTWRQLVKKIAEKHGK